MEEYRKRFGGPEAFDLAILDLTVPGGSGGAEAVRALRQIDTRVRAIAISGYSTDPIISGAEKSGFDAAVSKPFRLDEISRTVQEVLQRSRAP